MRKRQNQKWNPCAWNQGPFTSDGPKKRCFIKQIPYLPALLEPVKGYSSTWSTFSAWRKVVDFSVFFFEK